MIAATMMSVSAGSPAAPSAATMSSAGRGAAGMMAMAGNMARPTGGSMAPPSKPTGGTGGGPSKPSGGTGGTSGGPSKPSGGTGGTGGGPSKPSGGTGETGGGPSKPSGGTGGTGGGPSKPAGGMGGAGGGPATQTRGAGGSGDAPGCTSTSGSDCDDACGNGAIDTGETCDPESTSNQCPSACDDSNPCTLDKLEGSATECTASCRHTPITTAAAGDGCCPPNATAGTDSDCQQQACGDGVVGAGETCDPMSVTDRCPTSCDDDSDCTTDTLTGSAASCTAVCTNTPITIAASGDGCCPSDASPLNDADCDTFCGDGIVSVGELCDPESDTTCPTTCDDGDDCTRDDLEGSIAQCTAECIYTSLEATLAHFDGCCPPGETDRTDSDCERSCGNGTADPGEECDPSAPGEELDVTCDWYCSRIAQGGCSDDFDCPEGTLCVDAQCTTP
jgi:hypothetical protein